MKLATLCYIRQNNKILMIHRNKNKNDMHLGKWNGLGGKIKAGESPEECVIREVFEESGLLIRNPSLKGFITFPAFDDIEDWYVFIFCAFEFDGHLKTESDEGRLEWIEENSILSLPLWDGDRIFLKWLDNRNFFSAKFNYDKGSLIDYTVIFYPSVEGDCIS